MFIIPLTGKLSWRNPPVVTIGLILLNCLVYFIFQTGEPQKQYEVSEYYFSSGLVTIEVPHYIAYREGRRLDPSDLPHLTELDEEAVVRLYLDMERDYTFLKKLNNEEIITASDPGYSRWRALRAEYENRRSQIISIRYGFRPAYRSLLTAFKALHLL